MTRADGSIIEGNIVEVVRAKLVIALEQDPWRVDIPTADVRGIEIAAPAKMKESVLLLLATFGGVLLLTTYSGLASIHHNRFSVTSAILFMYTAGGAAFAFLVTRTRFGAWLKEWKQIYPPG